MSKLTDTQLIVLSAAFTRDDGYAVLPERMKATAASKVGASLVARKLMREMRAKPDMPVWRRDDENRAYSLVLTAAGRKAIGVEEGADELEGKAATPTKSKSADGGARAAAAPPTDAGRRSRKKTADPTSPASDTAAQTPLSDKAIPRAGSKQALVIDMLSSKTGTTLDALVDATGWLPHTARAALTGLRKRGLSIERAKVDGETSVYRIVLQQIAVPADTKSRAAA